ncbi:MAG TPA: DsbA family protein [Thermoplasmata archaeon]|nr:DsbA family protein [Thermoplasmata archaeon]
MTQQYQAPRLTVPVGARDHAEGPPGARVVLLEYGDYQCPYCGAAYPIVKRIQKHLGERLRFVFRNFPITNAHPQAQWAAEHAEASAAQGRFWQMHDYLYEHQDSLGDEAFFARFEQKLKLDLARLDREVAQHVHLDRIQEDFMSGVRSGVNGTPTFFINGVRYDGYPEFAPLVSALETAEKGSR